MKKIIPMALLGLCVAMPAYANMDKSAMDKKSDSWFSKIDSNGDGKISSAENKAFAEQMFTDTDTNNDGMISKDEMRAKHDREHAEMGYNKGDMAPSAGGEWGKKNTNISHDTPHNTREPKM